MSDAPTPKKSLNILLQRPVKIPVQTSLGILYVRNAYVSDWTLFESDDPETLGKLAVRQLVSKIEDKEDDTPLADEDLDALDNTDFEMLVPVIAKQSNWGEASIGANLQLLGQLMIDVKNLEKARFKKQIEDMRKSIDVSYKFLGKSSLDKLKNQLVDIADISRNLPSSLIQNALKNSMSGTDVLREAMRSAGLHDTLRASALNDTVRNSGAGIPFNEPSPEMRNIPMPTRPEDTPIGRGLIENAKHSRGMALKIDALAEVVGGLNQTLVTEVLPAWFQQVENNQHQANIVLSQAKSGLTWTKWTLIVSVIVSTMLTGWQILDTRELDTNNNIQQKKVESLLREQLATQKELIDQKVISDNKLRELIQQQAKHDEQLYKAVRLVTRGNKHVPVE